MKTMLHRRTALRQTTWVFLGLLGFGCLSLAIVFGNCGIPAIAVYKPVEAISNQVVRTNEQRHGPAPESEWNREKLWVRISDSPPCYLPRGYPRSHSTGPGDGSWMIDERDGKRLFIPKGGADGFPEAVLRAEARVATHWKIRETLKVTPGALLLGPHKGERTFE